MIKWAKQQLELNKYNLPVQLKEAEKKNKKELLTDMHAQPKLILKEKRSFKQEKPKYG